MPYMRVTDVCRRDGHDIITTVIYEGQPPKTDRVMEVFENGVDMDSMTLIQYLTWVRDYYEDRVAWRQAAPESWRNYIGSTIQYVDHNTMLVDGVEHTVPD